MTQRLRGFEVLTGFKHVNIPQRGTSLSAGYDLTSAITFTLQPGERKTVPTGLTVYMQDDEELQIRSRSGLTHKYGIIVLNAPGTIDADYYGHPIGVILYNAGAFAYEVKTGERIAQGVFSKYYLTDDDSPVREVRNGGFGSTDDRPRDPATGRYIKQ